MYQQILPSIRRPIVAAALATALLTAGASEAELLSYEGTAEITATEMPGEIDVGDLFDFTLTYDDASIDEEVSPFAGNFPTGLTAFTLTRRPSNTGTWDPAVGSFALPGRVQTQETQSRFRFQPGGTGFDTLNGSDFDLVDLLLQPVAINDTGLGQTIAEQLGGPLSGDLADFTDPSMNIFSVNFDRADGEVIAFVLTAELCPTPIDLTSGTSGSLTGVPQSFNETRGVDVTVNPGCGDLVLNAMTLHGLFISSASATVGARVYDSNTTALIASAETTVSNGSNLSVTLPLSATLAVGSDYRLSFFVDAGGIGGGGTMFDPDPSGLGGFPYTDATGTLDINQAYSIASDSFPTNPNIFVPLITLDLSGAAPPSVPVLGFQGLALLAALLLLLSRLTGLRR